ncbi:MAG: DUF4982 domain-containing protein [Pontiellaceae bacterium]|nr:DUF4982 domain-containing protein [Pontiellaceae bacterium]MBN2784853.1 DUF4982 domain-containing protein [Pontiellaceae bacterium]
MKTKTTAQRLVFCLICVAAYSASAREVVSLDPDWNFFQGDAAGAEKVRFNDAGWEQVDVPHDWCIAGPFDENAPTTGSGGWLPSGIVWYRKALEIPASAKGKSVWVEFDGVMANSDVWLNGKHLGHRPSGYFSFRYDVSKVVKPGANNVLVVRCDTADQPASRWYTGGGIYRHVRLIVADPLHIEPWGAYVTTPVVSTDSAQLHLELSVRNGSKTKKNAVVLWRVLDPDGSEVLSANIAAPLNAGVSQTLKQDLPLEHPSLWSLETPQLYTLISQVLVDGNVVDEVSTPFGVRSAEFRSETGFWLNGENLKIKGVCLHHCAGAVGAAVPLNIWERRLNLLRELGVNAIRTAHNPPAPEFLDLCDRMGFLVMDEFFDCWTEGKNPYDYHLVFEEWAHTDLRDGVLRDRNHPSVILYSVGNEIHDTPHEERAKKILRGLVDVCHAADPSRPVTQALFRPNVSHDYDNGLADMLDVIGTNYRDSELLQAWKDKPGRRIIGTEQGHSRRTWLELRDNPQHAGQFLWTGIDYLGESRSWPLTVFNAGLLDRCGFVMPRGSERQSWWSDKPMVKAFRRIDKTEDTPTDPGYEVLEWKRRQVLFPDWNPYKTDTHDENVEVYSNAEEVELILNGTSLGKKETRADAGALNWSVPYAPGTLESVAYIGGKAVARDVLRTAGEPASVKLVPGRDSIGLGFDDAVTVVVQLLDENGIVVPTADNRVTFSVSGPGKLIAVDSGNVVSTELFQVNERKAYQGQCIAVLRATGAGLIKLTASVDGLTSGTVELAVQ